MSNQGKPKRQGIRPFSFDELDESKFTVVNQDSQDEPTVAGSFFRRATMSSGDQPDGGDTWHISKKDWNAVMDENEASWNAHTQKAVTEAKYEAIRNHYDAKYLAQVVNDYLDIRKQELNDLEATLTNQDRSTE